MVWAVALVILPSRTITANSLCHSARACSSSYTLLFFAAFLRPPVAATLFLASAFTGSCAQQCLLLPSADRLQGSPFRFVAAHLAIHPHPLGGPLCCPLLLHVLLPLLHHFSY